MRGRRVIVAGLVLVLVAGLVAAAVVVWQRVDRTRIEQALGTVPAGSLRVSYTDWDVVRRELDVDLGDEPDRDAVESLIEKAYDSDYGAVSSIDESAGALQEIFGFSPATAQWEAFGQGRQGAAMVLKVAEGADFDILADNLRSAGYQKPEESDGVWEGGIDLVASLDPTISPELQHVALLEDEGLVVTSDNFKYAAAAAKSAAGDGETVTSVEGISDMAGRLGDPANAMVWAKDFACSDLAMSSADDEDQALAKARLDEVGGITPMSGMAMAMQPDRTLRVVQHFVDPDQAGENLRPRAELIVGEAIGRGGSFADDLKLVSSRAVGSDVVLDLKPRTTEGFVLSSVYNGPVLFATC